MTDFTNEKVRKIAHLARISISDEKVDLYAKNLNELFKEIDKLQHINTNNIAPISNVINEPTKYREDIVNDGNQTELVLKNSTHSKYDYFVVPKVVE